MENNLRKLILAVLILFVFVDVQAFTDGGDTIRPVSVEVKKPIGSDTLISLQEVIKKPHSPHRATIYAMVLPGLGQVYNGQWWKLPILYGGIGATIYGSVWNSDQFKKYGSAYSEYSTYLTEKARDPEFPYPENPAWDKVYKGNDVESFSPQQQSNFKNQLKNRRVSFKRNRDLLYIVMGGIYVLNIIDATVFAHFYDFEIDEDLSVNLQPMSSYSPIGGGSMGLCLTINF